MWQAPKWDRELELALEGSVTHYEWSDDSTVLAAVMTAPSLALRLQPANRNQRVRERDTISLNTRLGMPENPVFQSGYNHPPGPVRYQLAPGGD